jgi:hypothetical protein
MDEYKGVVDEALGEIQDFKDAIEFDEDEMSAAAGFVDHLDAEVRTLRDRLADGSYQFGNQDLPFMPIIADASTHFLPFKELLETINRTHREGSATGP